MLQKKKMFSQNMYFVENNNKNKDVLFKFIYEKNKT